MREVIIAASKFTERQKYNKDQLESDSIPSTDIDMNDMMSPITGLTTRRLISSQHSNRSTRPNSLAHLQQQYVNHFVHLTQRVLPPATGSRVRGVEMLPSVDVPNIPSSETRKRKEKQDINFGILKKQDSVVSETNTPTSTNIQQRYGSNETLPVRENLERHISRRKTINTNINIPDPLPIEQAEDQQHPPPLPIVPPDRISFSPVPKRNINVRPDIFRKKDSPVTSKSSSSNSNKSQTKHSPNSRKKKDKGNSVKKI